MDRTAHGAPTIQASAILGAALCLAGLPLAACGDAPAAPVELIEAPQRTAAQDTATRALLAEMARYRVCGGLQNRFVPLPEDRPGAQRRVTEGRLWVNDCRVTREGERLSLHLSGRGWQWVERTAPGPLGSSFTVRGTVRLEASIDITSELDISSDVDAHRVRIALTPTDPPRARVTPIGTIPIEPDGGWSGLIGGLGGLLGLSPRDQARPLLEEQAALTVRRQLASGATLTLDLCTGQPDLVLGPLADDASADPPPFDEGGVRWIDNARVRVHPGGLDLSGPWTTRDGDATFELDVESGGPVEVAVLCRDDAARLASSYLAGGDATLAGHVSTARVSGRAAIPLRGADCEAPHVLLTSPVDTLLRYRVLREGDEPEAQIDCE